MQAAIPMNSVETPPDPMDRKTFSILVREHHRPLMVYARALVFDESAAADLVQDAFVAAWKSLGRFDVTRDFGTWMRGIVRNKWRDHCRMAGRNREVTDADLEVMEFEMCQWEEARQNGNGQVFERLEICMKRLPETLATAVKAFYYDGLDGEGVAENLKVNAATVRKRLERARSALRECLDQDHSQTA